MSTLGLCYKRRVGVTQFSGLDFNSLCRLADGTVLGASADGVFALGGDDDNGEDIDAFAEFVTTDFGFPQQKRLRKILFGGEASGDLLVEVTGDENDTLSRTLSMDIDSQKQEGVVCQLGREVKGRYFKVKIGNSNGCDFAIDSLDVVVMLLAKKAGKVHFFSPFLSSSLPSITGTGTGA